MYDEKKLKWFCDMACIGIFKELYNVFPAISIDTNTNQQTITLATTYDADLSDIDYLTYNKSQNCYIFTEYYSNDDRKVMVNLVFLGKDNDHSSR